MKFILLLLFPLMLHAGIHLDSVQDDAQIFKPEEISSLRQSLKDLKAKGVWMVVHTITELPNTDIDSYSNDKFKQWEIGQKNKDNGLLLVIAVNDRKMRLEVGYGLEGVLTDIESNRLLNAHLRPAMRDNKPFDGVKNLVEYLISNISYDQNAFILTSYDPYVWLILLIPFFWILLPFSFHLKDFKPVNEILKKSDQHEIVSMVRKMIFKRRSIFLIFMAMATLIYAFLWDYGLRPVDLRVPEFLIIGFAGTLISFFFLNSYVRVWLWKNFVRIRETDSSSDTALLVDLIWLLKDPDGGSIQSGSNDYSDTSSSGSSSDSSSSDSSSGGGRSGGGGSSSSW